MIRDPYERVNVWSHGLPGLFFLMLGYILNMEVFMQCSASAGDFG